MIGKFILPWFGGSPGVWTVCMLFFQVLLLVGYAYAHLATRLLTPQRQALAHFGLLAIAVLVLPIVPAESWKPDASQEPTLHILLLLAATIGLPYFVLSTTGPLLQRWYSLLHGEAPPYRLFALSNAGSLLALLAFPFVIEPALSRSAQTTLWSWAMAVFAVLCAACAFRLWRSAGTPAADEGSAAEDAAAPLLRDRLLWLALPTVASVMLLATTNKLSQEVAAIPFLWVLPLALYLLSFILCFESSRWYRRPVFAVLLLLAVAEYDTVFAEGFPTVLGIAALALILFVVSMICHGEVYRLRPHPRFLTSFYLMISAGGALGGVFVALFAPLFLIRFEEFELGLVGCAVLVLVVHYFDESSPLHGGRPRAAWACIVLAMAGLGLSLAQNIYASDHPVAHARRNFYGSLYIKDRPSDAFRILWSGTTMHGFQVMKPELQREPTGYYNRRSGVGLALRALADRKPLHVGVVGLGVGTLAAYGAPGDRIRFYEINPLVADYAREHFRYLADSPMSVEVVLGDARLSMEQEPPQDFDLLVLDAFTSDAVPVHLVTAEAFEIYLRHLRPDGILAMHVSNRHVDMKPVLKALAERFGLEARSIVGQPRLEDVDTVSHWVVMARDRSVLAAKPLAGAPPLVPDAEPVLWTDGYTSLFRLIR